METGKIIILVKEQKEVIEYFTAANNINQYGTEILNKILKNGTYYSKTAPWLNILRAKYIKHKKLNHENNS